MKPLFEFNLVVVAAFVLGVAATALVAHEQPELARGGTAPTAGGQP